jgi:hypothetical protein
LDGSLNPLALFERRMLDVKALLPPFWFRKAASKAPRRLVAAFFCIRRVFGAP